MMALWSYHHTLAPDEWKFLNSSTCWGICGFPIWNNVQNIKIVTDPPGFEPGSEAPEASILSRLYYESILAVHYSAQIAQITKAIRAKIVNI
jgi:hypothetical protein